MKTITAKKNLALQVIMLIVLLMTITLTVKAEKQDRKVGNFTKIEVSGAFNVILTQGSSASLTLEASEELLEKVISEVKGDKLILRLENNTRITGTDSPTAYISFINLEEIDLSGAVKISGTNTMKFENLEIEGSGASKVNLTLSANRLKCEASGASDIMLAGDASAFEADLSGASKIDAEELKTVNCTLDCSGASTSKVYVTGSLKVDGSGACKVIYTGNPKQVDSDMSGASKISKG